MTNETHSLIESNYRAFYGKLFSALIKQFGVNYVDKIEDAIQNSFYKSLKSWKPNQLPKSKENWLYIVARNDVINQIKKENKTHSGFLFIESKKSEFVNDDLRLQTILFISNLNNISAQAKVIFILKNIFGLNIKEISESTLLSEDAIYKGINRTKKSLQLEFGNKSFYIIFQETKTKRLEVVEEILYAVFNIGFDSFDEKNNSIVNDDLCLEALSLVKLLSNEFNQESTKNLLSLFCFHIARIPAKVVDNKFISFFEQDKTKWNNELIELGFSYLQKPDKLDKFYLEALITSKYMIATSYNIEHWMEIIKLYELLTKLSNSPIIKLNLCYCLYKAQRTDDALKLLDTIKNEFPNKHIYFSLVKANIIKETDPKKSGKIMSSVLNNINHAIRKEYILENGFINL